MPLRLVGRNIDLGDSLRERLTERVDKVLKPLFQDRYKGTFTVKKDGHNFHADCLIHIQNASSLHSDAKAGDAYAACDAAVHKIEQNLRRYKSKLKMRNAPELAVIEAPSYVIEAIDDGFDEEQDFKPVIIAETTLSLKMMSVGEAVEELDMTGAPFMVFKHAGNGRMNVVYKRGDGNVGWIDPPLLKEKA